MKEKFRYLPHSKRKNILLLSDDIRLHSGVGTMAREIVINTAHHFNWVNLGAAVKHPEEGKALNLSGDVNKFAGIDDADVVVVPSTGYGDPTKLRTILGLRKFDAIMIFTDPRYWDWLFDMEREVRSKIPIFYLNIWDNYPSPLYNKSFYQSVDVLMAISKQTKNINELVLGEDAKDKIIEYVPHGIDETKFFPITSDHDDYSNLMSFRKNLFKEKNDEIEFVVLFNSRNIRRKNVPDTILAYRHFCDKIGKEKSKKCALVLHSSIVDNNGTDLSAVVEAFCDPEYINVFFSDKRLQNEEMNYLYNISDVNILLSSNEGWGLSLTESLVTGTMIIPNVTGGMQDQCRFEDSNGKWVDFNENFPSNHRGTIQKCGRWAVPVFPTNISILGSPPTPYIFDDRCSPEDAAAAIEFVFNLDPQERVERGLEGREWAMSDEAGFTAVKMSNKIIEICDLGFEKFKPLNGYEVIKIQDLPKKYIQHKLTDYTYE